MNEKYKVWSLDSHSQPSQYFIADSETGKIVGGSYVSRGTAERVCRAENEKYNQKQQNPTLHRPESYVLASENSAWLPQVTHFPNGSLHLAFSADEDLHECVLTNMAQFEHGESVTIPQGWGTVDYAYMPRFSFGSRTYYHVAYSVMYNGTRFKFTEFELLDWDNYKDPQATDLYRSFQKHYLGGNKVEAPYVAKTAAKKWCQSCTDEGIGSDWILTREGWLCDDCFYTKNEEYKEAGEPLLTAIMNGATYYKLVNKE